MKTDAALVEDAVSRLYECEGLPPPKAILWMQSPIEGAAVADVLVRVQCLGPRAAASLLCDLIVHPDLFCVDFSVLDKIRSQIWRQAWDMFGRDIGHQLDVRLRGRERQKVSRHYSIWPKVLRTRIFEDISGNEVDTDSDEIFSHSLNSWDCQLVSAEERLFRGTSNHDYQYDLGEGGRAIAHAMEYFADLFNNAHNKRSGEALELVSKDHSRNKSLKDIATNCDWIWLFEGICVLTSHPTVLSRDALNRLHREDGPAMSYADGKSFYVWHGVTVPRFVVESPEEISVKCIEAERNSEIRRIMIERYGLARYVVDSGFKKIQTIAASHPIAGLRTGRLWVQNEGVDEPVVYVDLLNSTPEPDGSTKRYMLRVDPTAYNGDAMRYVQAAAASTWRNADGGLIYSDWRGYAPNAES